MLPRAAVIGALMFSISAVACDLARLEHSLVFSPDEPTLSTTEILKLAEWDSRLKDDFRGDGKYQVRLQEASEPAPNPELTVLRLKNPQTMLGATGAEGDKVEPSETDTHPRTVGREGIAPHIPTATYVTSQSGCQNPCCPDAVPVTSLAPRR